MSDYSQTRSFNVGIACDTSIESAMIYDDLVYAQKVFGEGYFFRSDEQMLKRFPMMSKNTIRRHVAKLVEAGYITTKVNKVHSTPKLHYHVEKFLNTQNEQKEIPKMGKSMEIPKMGKSLLEDNLKISKSDSISLEDNNSAADGRTGAPALPLLEQIIQIINPKEKATAERLRVLNGRLKDYSADEIIGSARAFSKSQWHKENKQMSVDNLLAPSKFGRWYAVREDQPANEFAEENVTIENQDEMVRRRMGGTDGTQ